jgi:hypothetical protein
MPELRLRQALDVPVRPIPAYRESPGVSEVASQGRLRGPQSRHGKDGATARRGQRGTADERNLGNLPDYV